MGTALARPIIAKKQVSLLGEYALTLSPGYTGDPLRDGDRIKNIRVVDAVDGHDIDCKVDGIGSMKLKSEFVKKA